MCFLPSEGLACTCDLGGFSSSMSGMVRRCFVNDPRSGSRWSRFLVGRLCGPLQPNLTPDTTFPQTDHRWHRVNTPEKRKAWLIDGLKKVDHLTFLTEGTGRTLRQAAIQFVLSEPSVASCLPNIYNEEQLREFAGTPETTPLTQEDLARIQELYEHNFHLEVSHECSG